MGGSLEAKIRKLQAFYWSDSDPDGRGFVNLADAYRKDGDPLEALRILREGLRRHPRLASGHVVRGWVYAEQGDSDDAEEAFRAALGVDPGNVSALRGLGELLARKGETVEALEILRLLLPLDPLDGDLPDRIREMEASVGPLTAEAGEPSTDEAPAKLHPWDDPEGAAEELDWSAAALQADQSVEEDGVEPGAPPAESSPGSALLSPPVGSDALVTRTMGEIFLRQGLLDEAEGVFERLLDRDQGNQALRSKLEEVRARQRGESVVSTAPADSFPGAFGRGTPDLIVPIQELSAGGILPIEALAPDLIYPIQELAPDVIVPINSLAPDSSPENPTLDAFEAWLDELP